MIRLCELSPARSAELELRYNGPIPREMIEWAYAQDRADERRAAHPHRRSPDRILCADSPSLFAAPDRD